MRSIAWRSSASLAKRALVGSSRPRALDPGRRRAADEDLVDLGVGEQRLERPEPERALGDPLRERLAGALVEHPRLAVDERADAGARVLVRARPGGCASMRSRSEPASPSSAASCAEAVRLTASPGPVVRRPSRAATPRANG